MYATGLRAIGLVGKELSLYNYIYWLFGLSSAPCLCRFTRCSADPSTITALLEARRVYATGLLAIGLAANEACAEAVRNGMAVELAKVKIAALM